MAILYVTEPKEIKSIDLSAFSLMFLIDKNDKLSKKLSKKIYITTVDKEGNLIYSNLIKKPYYSSKVEVLNYFVFKKQMTAMKFKREKAYLEYSYQSKKKTDKIFYESTFQIIYNFAIKNNDKNTAIEALKTSNQEIRKSVFDYIEYLQPNFNKYQKVYFHKALKIYRNLFYTLMSYWNKNSKYANPNIFSLHESYILFLLSDIFINYKLEREDIKNREFNRDFLKILFRLFNEKINHASKKNILHYFNITSNQIEELENGGKLKGMLCY